MTDLKIPTRLSLNAFCFIARFLKEDIYEFDSRRRVDNDAERGFSKLKYHDLRHDSR